MPFIADLKPSGKYVMEDVQGIGGTPAVMKYLLEKGFIDGSCLVSQDLTLSRVMTALSGRTALR